MTPHYNGKVIEKQTWYIDNVLMITKMKFEHSKNSNRYWPDSHKKEKKKEIDINLNFRKQTYIAIDMLIYAFIFWKQFNIMLIITY